MFHRKFLRVVLVGLTTAATFLCAAQTTTKSAQSPDEGFDCSVAGVRAVANRLFIEQASTQLRSVILPVDVLHLQICEGAGDRAKIAADAVGCVELNPELHATGTRSSCLYVHDQRGLTWDQFGDAVRPQAEANCITDGQSLQDCLVEIYRLRSLDETVFAKSGGLPFAALLGHIGKKGHFEITGYGALRVAKDFSGAAVEVLQQGSRDPDFFDWETPAAHAQADFNATTLEIVGSVEQAQTNFLRWTAAHLRAARSFCSQGKHQMALYRLGYALHAPQDAVFHEGISNPQHAYLDLKGVGVDSSERYDEKFELAVKATQQVLLLFKRAAGPSCWTNLTHWTGPGVEMGSEWRLEASQRRRKDFTLSSWWRYRNLGIRVDEARKAGRANNLFLVDRWLGEERQQALDALLSRIWIELEPPR
nr:hypothetical protein [uncultured Roseateles sp.]